MKQSLKAVLIAGVACAGFTGAANAQQRMVDETGLMFVVSQTALRFHRPARLDDLLRVTVEPQHTA